MASLCSFPVSKIKIKGRGTFIAKACGRGSGYPKTSFGQKLAQGSQEKEHLNLLLLCLSMPQVEICFKVKQRGASQPNIALSFYFFLQSPFGKAEAVQALG